MTAPGYEGRHREVLAVPVEVLPEAQRPEAGPIAVLPEPEELFVAAVEAAGGQVAPLGPETRGLIWLDSSGGDAFAEALAAHPSVGWVQLPWAGVDAFAGAIAEQSRPDLVWTSAKGAYAQPVAEHALTLTLALLRELPVRLRTTSWGAKTGSSLYGLDVVIVGAGGIALELLRLLEPFGVRTTIVRRSPDPVPAADRTVTSDRLAEVLPGADVVVVAAALTAGTGKLFDADAFALMKPSAVLVNIARGGLVDTDALVEALESGVIAGAGVDVTDPEPLPDGHPLYSLPTAIVTPHSADTPEMIAPLLAARIRHNVAAFLGKGDFAGLVDPVAGY
ncbi:D-isomer specific 2-hydroxyacid dehydrogenase family protein [Herbiconiux moechotypicola]|uniref:D-isomer specific 2-hydroxyacid dehydrogenase family protein n=1 Tax=Herbiconiux moechotypicola TaxID=637393 RepID=A0ABP5Q103_9MICO|nr:D-isomer specific 2-hydroxyacid dehydrogenase family protein [Herbiconiux moechotypicola]MCS5728508.1 D-isomer specific 2-hydroxyacid dehydrogenase family protein [Herbiconiux moechotypicola]